MIPRELFFQMAALALVAILLAGVLSLQAFAVEDDFQDSGFLAGEVTENLFPGEPPESLPDDLSSNLWDELPEDDSNFHTADMDALLTEISGIRQSLDLILYFVIPCSAAILLVYKLCMWFYCTFIDLVL